MPDYLEISELYHFGIKGQKWGIRRYQNSDGSLTEAGRRRYYVDSQGTMSDVGYEKYKKDVDEDIRGRHPRLESMTKAKTAATLTVGAALAARYFSRKMEKRGNSSESKDNRNYYYSGSEFLRKASGIAILSVPLVNIATRKYEKNKNLDIERKKNIEYKNYKRIKKEEKEYLDSNIEHSGIKGQKWGVRRYQNEDGTLTEAGKIRYNKLDEKWAKAKSEKIYNKAYRESSDEMRNYLKTEMKGETGKTAINKFNKKLAEVMRTKTSNVRSPSGKVVEWVAKRGHVGVYMALADPGYDMRLLKSGVWENGRVAYKKEKVDMK